MSLQHSIHMSSMVFMSQWDIHKVVIHESHVYQTHIHTFLSHRSLSHQSYIYICLGYQFLYINFCNVTIMYVVVFMWIRFLWILDRFCVIMYHQKNFKKRYPRFRIHRVLKYNLMSNNPHPHICFASTTKTQPHVIVHPLVGIH